MNFESILSRCDIENYQNFLGADIIGTLGQLDSKYLYAKELDRVLLNSYSPYQLLSNPDFRSAIFLLLRESEAVDLLNALGKQVKSDPWETLNKTKFDKADLKKVLAFFEVEVPVEPIKENWVDSEVISPGYGLYPYQRSIIVKIDKVMRTRENRLLLHMPTGSGKTRTTISYACNRLSSDERGNVIWLATTRELLDQAYDEFCRAWSFLGNREIKAYKLWSESRINLNEIEGSFIVAGVGKAYNMLLENAGTFSAFASTCSLVIMDEAHQTIAPTYQLLIESLIVSKKADLIGLSATPGRTWNDRGADKLLAKFFYYQKAKVRIDGFDNPVDYLISEGYLAKANYTTLLHNSGIELTTDDLLYLRNNCQLADKILERISKDRLRNLLIVSKVQELVKTHQRIILFAITKEHAMVLNSLLTALGVDSRVVTSDTPDHERAQAIDAFKVSRKLNSAPKVLCNFGILTTGFDAPETSCAVIARPTDSLVLYSQMVGRAVRGVRSGGNLEAEIVTVIDESLPGFGNVADAFTNWDDVWKEIE
jgi:DNA repair protein RadD